MVEVDPILTDAEFAKPLPLRRSWESVEHRQ
jgi:hypothetical protein